MKSKRRHEMQTNWLANWIGTKIEKVKPHANLILLGVLGVVALIVAVAYFINRGKQQTAKEWGGYTIEANKRERDPVKLTKVAQSDPDSPAHLWALQAAADTHRAKGVNLLYEEREEGLKELEASIKLYEEILKRSDDDFLQRRARYALAKALESSGDIDAATKHYTELKSSAGDYAIGKDAERQLARLRDQKEFYTSFAEFKPSDPADSVGFEPLPDRPDISFPGDSLPLPERPDVSFPEDSGSTSGGEFQPAGGETNSGDTAAATGDDETGDGETN